MIVHAVAALLSQNQLARRQESLGYMNCLFKKSARVVSQIQQAIHALGMEKVEADCKPSAVS